MDKEIKIRAVLDSASFDKGINEIQEKLKKIVQQQNQASGAKQALGKDSVMGKYAQQAFGDFSKESQRQLEQMYQVQRREAVNQSITMKGKQQELEKMAKTDADMTKQQKERLENLKKEIDLLKEKQKVTLITAAETQKALDKMGGGAGGGAPPGAAASAPPAAGPSFFSQMIRGAGIAAIVKGALNASLMGMEDIITRDRKISVNQAASMNMASREMREQFEGRGSRGMFYAPERARAMRGAAGEQSSMGVLDMLRVAGGTAGGALIGGGIGAVGGFGFGAIPGAIGGGIAGFSGTMATSEKLRARVFDQEKYRSMMTKEGMEKYEANLAAEKAKNPRRQMAQEYFEQNRENIGNLQRQLGLSRDSQLFGRPGTQDIGLLREQMSAGGEFGGVNFGQQTIEQQVQGLAAGGAQTGAMRDLSGKSAAYGRQFNLGNAAQVMGGISGAGGTSAQTEAAYKKLLTEAVRLGVDTSTMPKEMERMTQITASLVTGGGVQAFGMQDVFGAGLAGLDMKSMQSAAGAAETFRATAKEAGGWEGQMGMGFLQSGSANKLLGGKSLSAKDMNYINQLSYTEMDEAGFQSLGTYLGISSGDAKELLRQKDVYKQSRTGSEESAYRNLGEYLKEQGQMSGEELKDALSSGKGAELFRAAESERSARGEGFMGKDVATRRAEILSQAKMTAGAENFETPEGELSPEEKIARQMQRKEGRAAFVEEGAIATGDMARIDALNEQIDGLKNAARNHTKYAEEYNHQFEALVNATKKGANAMDAVAAQLTSLEEKMNDEALRNGHVPMSKPPENK